MVATAGVVLAVFAGGLLWQSFTGENVRDRPSNTVASPATFAGSEACAGCHRAEARLWRSSQHKQAMDHATDESVRGEFNDTGFDYYGIRSRFFRKDGKFFVETDGAEGKLATFEVKYTFGLEPLQQYLIEFPDGRLQALSIAWDSRPKEAGGQRWFHLYPHEQIRHDDVLHWTRLNQNWNFMCAECHSTGLRKNYDAARDRFATTWSEISVGCEACHGRGSRHVAWARAQESWWPFGKPDDPAKGLAVRFDERTGITWSPHPQTGQPERNIRPALLRKEVETCGLCHARRGVQSEDWVPGRWLSDTHRISPLDRRHFHADGQMRDDEETYNYAAFKQSRMFAAGVTCSDCHDPHSAGLRAPGDGVCGQCHAADRYETATHHRHAGANPSLSCASCHMPARTYMVIDRRHDHSFRIPRPDLSVQLGTPNACNDCHRDRPAQWAARAVEGWYGARREGFQDYARAFHAAWTARPDAQSLLSIIASGQGAPAFVRASALVELSAPNIELVRRALSDADPMVRIGALDMLENVSGGGLWPLVSPLLSDPVRGVRIQAANLLAAVPADSQPAAERERFVRGAEEFIAAQRLNADRPESRTALGSFFARRGDLAQAEAEYKAALRLQASFSPAAINLADLYRQLGRDAEGEEILRTAIQRSPRDAATYHALGLALTRRQRSEDALDALRRAAELAPEHARYTYVYAVALHSSGLRVDAMTILKKGLSRHPADRDMLLAAVSFSREAGDTVAALAYAEHLARVSPNEQGLAKLIEHLRAGNVKAPH